MPRFFDFRHLTIPSPFHIALIINILVVCLAWWFGYPQAKGFEIIPRLAMDWKHGFWSFIPFTLQMVMMLSSGYLLASHPGIQKYLLPWIDRIHHMPQAVAQISFLTMGVSLLNWGAGLVVGSYLVKITIGSMQRRRIPMHTGLLAASGYCGMMIWHSGLSGSAPLLMAQNDHFLMAETGVIPLSSTLFSKANLVATFLIWFTLPMLLYIRARFIKSNPLDDRSAITTDDRSIQGRHPIGIMGWHQALGMGMIAVFILSHFNGSTSQPGSILDEVNFIFLGMALIFYRSEQVFWQKAKDALSACVDILYQFPLYAAVAYVLKESGLIMSISNHFLQAAEVMPLSFVTFLSAAFVNFLVPSGGGQWIVQGPAVMEAASMLQASYSEQLLAFAWGDQLTNMLQPFWALPLLGITGLSLKELWPSCLWIFGWGLIIFSVVLLCL